LGRFADVNQAQGLYGQRLYLHVFYKVNEVQISVVATEVVDASQERKSMCNETGV
jgi:hypothetical protein